VAQTQQEIYLNRHVAYAVTLLAGYATHEPGVCQVKQMTEIAYAAYDALPEAQQTY